MINNTMTQLVFVTDHYEAADDENSEEFDLVQDEGARWHRPEFHGQRVSYRPYLNLGFMAREVEEDEYLSRTEKTSGSDGYRTDDGRFFVEA